MDEEKKSPLEGYVIATAHGKDLIGKLVEAGAGVFNLKRLNPVYQLFSQMVPSVENNNTVNIVFKAMPVSLLFSIKELDIPADALMVPVASLDKSEVKVITAAVAEVEEMVRKTRAARAGLTLVEGLPKGLPTLKDILDKKNKL